MSPEDERKLFGSISKSRSPALLPLFILSIDGGFRASEVRALRRRDLSLVWKNSVIERGAVTIPKSKTEAGTGRLIPLTKRACAVLTLWLARFPAASEQSFVFSRHSVGLAGDNRAPLFYHVDLDRPIGEWKKAWAGCLGKAGTRYRWHDLRHTCYVLANDGQTVDSWPTQIGNKSSVT